MEEYLWLFSVAGGAFLLGGVLVYGVLRQRRLSPHEQDLQNRKVRELYGDGQPVHAGAAADGSSRRRTRLAPLVLAAVFIVIGCALGYYVAMQPSVPSASVTGKEGQNAEPAGPADEDALPGQQ